MGARDCCSECLAAAKRKLKDGDETDIRDNDDGGHDDEDEDEDGDHAGPARASARLPARVSSLPPPVLEKAKGCDCDCVNRPFFISRGSTQPSR